ncbi:hypothetical protein RIF29_26072 [Crotalaria pallida]|uniref:Uncharacterized protein n=1 Tax=Crotalaria pallida TaxID=3830 RepID=A0AAN9I4M2_CROPI
MFEVLQHTYQMVHCNVKQKQGNHEFNCAFVYAANETDSRIELWNDLINLSVGMDKSWLILGDFNCFLEAQEKLGGNPVDHSNMKEFRESINDCQDLNRRQFNLTDLKEIKIRGNLNLVQ